MITLSIVIPVLNQWHLTAACLHSLQEHTAGGFYEVIVVDNGSTDETPHSASHLLEELFPGRNQYLRQEIPCAFGPACNLGAGSAAGEFLFFLNNDTEVTNGWAGPLFKALRDDERLVAVSPLLLYPDTRRVQHLGVVFDPNLHPSHLYAGFSADHPAVHRPRNLQALSAAALFLRRKSFLDCNGFHEGFRNGSEDLDLCCQFLRQGYRLACVSRSVVLHHTSCTEGRFDSVQANAKLLNERCRGCFTSDLHRFASRDGFTLQLTSWLEPYLVGPPPQEIEADLEAQLATSPLWEQGYTLLVAKLEREGRVEDALHWQELCAGFFPKADHFSHAIRLAAMAEDDSRISHWEGRLGHVRSLLVKKQELVRRAQENLAWFRQSGEQEMSTLYAHWMASEAWVADLEALL